MYFELVSEIAGVVTIAAGRGIHDLAPSAAAWRGALAQAQRSCCGPPEQWPGSACGGTLV